MNWKDFLKDVSEAVTKSEDLQSKFESERDSKWLGFSEATDSEISKSEARLKIVLPPSYKQFLKASNGFKQLNTFVWDILPVEKIDWIKYLDPEFYELYSGESGQPFNASDEEYFIYGDNQKSTDFRSKYLIDSLAISNWGDASIVLLNPHVKFGEEWEAWVFTVWSHGPSRYKSFEELMKQEYKAFIKLQNYL
jgi:hypothetical protein